MGVIRKIISRKELHGCLTALRKGRHDVCCRKIALLAREFQLDERLRPQRCPLIYPTLIHAAAFVLLLFSKLLEEAALGLDHGKSVGESICAIGGGKVPLPRRQAWLGPRQFGLTIILIGISTLILSTCGHRREVHQLHEEFGTRFLYPLEECRPWRSHSHSLASQRWPPCFSASK